MASKKILAGLFAGLVLCSAAVHEFIGRWEGEEEFIVYPDQLAKGLPTVCRGLTHHITSTPIIVGEVWSSEKCRREELAAIEKVQLELLNCFRVAPPQQVFDAATSHAWNFGSAKTCASESMQAWNKGDWQLGCRRLLVTDGGGLTWVYSGSQFVRGLANRRAAEMVFCEGR